MKVIVLQCPCGTLVTQPFAFGGASTRGRHSDAGTRLIKKHQLRDIERELVVDPFTPRSLHVFAFLLAGVQGFLKGSDSTYRVDAIAREL